MNFSAAELTGIVGHYLWPLARIGAMVSLAPIFGTRTVPAKIKIILSFAIVVPVAPVIETPTPRQPFSLEGLEMLAMERCVGGMIAFGGMTRASPQLNIFAIGFPITIGIGFVIMIVTLSYFSSKFTLLVEELFLFLQRALV